MTEEALRLAAEESGPGRERRALHLAPLHRDQPYSLVATPTFELFLASAAQR